ncbi:FO synthase subunit 1 [Quadrisphaera granulorum]|uniref:7,8-didemethyl-8-hydroxy-5-deazariboflavin synthase n=1 Tax=Quadrisphaera granulorum TaxID=317664 RepID=A0A316A5K4_9ACTN|nr:7,8-didemethyl-8-hydroxy-5-deazariboflavin synthase CofG [Quadrisphaera granulorum]PWJ52762.1 FO synthase subunit 1 [Quadrisphaera granulorum]SZE97367.1 FO synthase subunit 1 [Quadrisphaera granulorum]
MSTALPGPTSPPSGHAVEAALRVAEAGGPLDPREAEALLAARGLCDGDPLDRLLRVASAVRDAGLAAAGRPGVVTYSRKVFVPITTLCRDRCHYCTFVDTPLQLARAGRTPFMTEDEVLALTRDGAALECKEALFTLGDRPEARWPEARQWLEAHGFASTLDYVRHLAVLVREETGMLPHLNPGVMTADELADLRPVAASMGMMLETTSRELFERRGAVHFGSPDKDPAVRLQVLEDAGVAVVPFTTGVLLGIGETPADRIESLLAIADVARRHGHVREVIVQNFRAKPRTAMRGEPDLALQEYAAALAVARLLLGPDLRVQAPPNLSATDDDGAELALLLRAGVDDWGGVSPLTPDHVNPERPWPHLADLARWSAKSGFELRERLALQPEHALDAQRWLDPAVAPAVAALAGPDGLAVQGRRPVGLAPRRPAA